MLVTTKLASHAQLDALKAVSGPLDGLIVKLFTNSLTIDHDSVAGDFTEATFDGYAASTAIAWGATHFNANNKAQLVGDTKQFTAGASVASETVQGYFVVDGSGDLVFAERFDSPVTISEEHDAISVVPVYTLGSLTTSA